MDPKVMKRKGLAYKAVNSFLIAFAIGVVLGCAAPAVQGTPLTWESFGWALWQGTLVGGIVGFVLPIPRILEFYFENLHVGIGLGRKIVTDMVLATIFAIVMGFYFTASNTGFETFMTDAGPVTFMNRMMNGFEILWAYIFVGAFVAGPICAALATKITGFDPEAAAAAAAAASKEPPASH